MWVGACLAAIACGLIVFVLGRRLYPKNNLDKRFSTSASASPADVKHLLKKENLSEVEALKRILSQNELPAKIEVLLRTAKLKISVAVFLLICIVLTCLFFILFQAWAHPLLAGFIALCIGSAPISYLIYRRKRYLTHFAEGLPNALSAISSSIKAGRGLEISLEVLAKTSPYPVGYEFGLACTEMKLGIPLAKALNNLYKRVGNPELKILITGIAVHQELGGNLSEILDNLEKTMRERFTILREIKTLSAQGRYSAWVLFVIPVALIALYIRNNPDQFFQFINSSSGGSILWISLALDLAGFIWVQRIVRLRD